MSWWLLLSLGSAQAPADSARADSVAADTVAPDTAPKYRIVAGGPVSVSARLKSRADKLTVGDQFQVELVVKRPRDVQASQPFMAHMEPFAVADRKSVTRYKGDTIVDTHTLKMAAFATGELKLPPFIVAYPSNGEVLAAASDSIPVKVASVLPKDMKDINDLKKQVQFPNYLPLWILLGVIAACALGWLGWRLYRRYRRMKLYGAPLPDPWDEALAALDAVPADELLKGGHTKRYYYTVSEILKRYLTRRFLFPAIDQTTTEIVRSMKAARTPEREGFGEFFVRADMVKYAKFVPPESEVAGVIPAARELVKTTTPKPEPEKSPTTKTQRQEEK